MPYGTIHVGHDRGGRVTDPVLHVSRTDAQYLTPHAVEGLP